MRAAGLFDHTACVYFGWRDEKFSCPLKDKLKDRLEDKLEDKVFFSADVTKLASVSIRDILNLVGWCVIATRLQIINQSSVGISVQGGFSDGRFCSPSQLSSPVRGPGSTVWVDILDCL